MPATTSTNVTWLQKDRRVIHNIYINDQIHKNLRRRFSIYNAAVGDYSLKILNIQPVDEGQYRCFNEQRMLQNYLINVIGQ